MLAKPSNTITLNALEIDFHDVTITAGGQTQTAKVSTDANNETATFRSTRNFLPERPRFTSSTPAISTTSCAGSI